MILQMDTLKDYYPRPYLQLDLITLTYALLTKIITFIAYKRNSSQ